MSFRDKSGKHKGQVVYLLYYLHLYKGVATVISVLTIGLVVYTTETRIAIYSRDLNETSFAVEYIHSDTARPTTLSPTASVS
jgi:hypothetical protein